MEPEHCDIVELAVNALIGKCFVRRRVGRSIDGSVETECSAPLRKSESGNGGGEGISSSLSSSEA